MSERCAKADCSFNVDVFANDNVTFCRMFTCVRSKSRGLKGLCINSIRILVPVWKLQSNVQVRSQRQTMKPRQA